MEGGHSLNGGGDGNSPHQKLSTEELRKRRVAALSQSQSLSSSNNDNNNDNPKPVKSVSIAEPAVTNTHHNSNDDDDDEDAELQAALALSLQQQQQQQHHHHHNESNNNYNYNEHKNQPDTITTKQLNDDDNNNAVIPWKLSDTVRTEITDQISINLSTSTNNQPFQILQFHKLMWDNQFTMASDKNRWVGQGIDVREEKNTKIISNITTTTTTTTTTALDILGESHTPWGIVQQHGGPCGVLAAVQAELIRILAFENPTTLRQINTLSDVGIEIALARAIAILLSRVTLTPSAVVTKQQQQRNTVIKIVVPKNYATNKSKILTWQDLEPWDTNDDDYNTKNSNTTDQLSDTLLEYSIPIDKFINESDDLLTRINRAADVVECVLLNKQPTSDNNGEVCPLDCFRRPGGVMLLVMSLTSSRTIETIQIEFDDPNTKLTGQFGHCGQELINLLLTGQAVSNVFDNTLSPSGDMVCRGIQHRPLIGYLSQLEAMRYCEVGGYYKSPIYPIWVVGSQSHFTVLFSDPASLKESQSDMLLDECRRAFKAVEGGEENGFIKTEQLEIPLQFLNIKLGTDTANESSRVQTLAAYLEVGGAGIILWDDFWKACSRLLTGASLETVLQGDGSSSGSPIIIRDDGPPPLIANYAENPDMSVKPHAAAATATVTTSYGTESDEEMARRLGAEWNNDDGGMQALSAAANAAAPMVVESNNNNNNNQGLSDEEIARKLQEQFDAENAAGFSGGGGSSVGATTGSPIHMDDSPTASPTPPQPMDTVEEEDIEDSKPAATTSSTTNGAAAAEKHTLPFEKYGETFSLYHYNGLRGGLLTPFRITRLTAEEAVGASIALNRSSAGGSSHGSSSSQDLEDVVRTKWPSCAINWLGKQPPYID